MKIKNAYGRETNINATKYCVDWDKKVSKPQKAVKDILRPFWAGHLVLEEFRIPSSKLRVDLLNLSLGIVVEISPSSSHKYNPFFHKNRFNFLASKKREFHKVSWSELNGFVYIEVGDVELNSPEKILELIVG